MAEHFTKNTVSAAFFCGKCGRHTQHRIDNGRKGPCLECLDRLESIHKLDAARKRLAGDFIKDFVQGKLF